MPAASHRQVEGPARRRCSRREPDAPFADELRR
jgi:hypothetical protein